MSHRPALPTLASVIRALDDRVRRIELRQRAAVGPWVIEVGPGGHLVARHAPTGDVHVLAAPPEVASEQQQAAG